MKPLYFLFLSGCTQIILTTPPDGDAGELTDGAKLMIGHDGSTEASVATDAAVDAPKADTSTPADSGVVQDSGIVVDSGIPDSGAGGLCHVVNYAPRDCDGTPQQDFYVIESCGMNCTKSTPCLQKMPTCPLGYTCAIYNFNTKKLEYGTCQ